GHVSVESGRRQRHGRRTGRQRPTPVQRLQRRRDDRHLGQWQPCPSGARRRQRRHGPQPYRDRRCPRTGQRRHHHGQRSDRNRRQPGQYRPGSNGRGRRRRGGHDRPQRDQRRRRHHGHENGVVTVSGLAETVTISNFHADDRIVINGIGGDDVITASGLTGMLLTENGGDGDNVLVGSPGNDTLNGGNGDDVLLGRAGLADVTRRFDITWFLGAIHKYRYLLSEVLLASFFLQLIALVSPLFFQVVIDKVLVHRALTTLDVLVIGLVSASLFGAILGILRSYLFAHP